MICSVLGTVLFVEGGFMLPPLVIALARAESESALGFGVAVAVSAALGFALKRIKKCRNEFYAREGFVTVGLAWLVLSLVGAIPFSVGGAVDTFLDGFFETVSGFTTTGASILNSVEDLPRSLLYWRSFTNWLGGMGVLVFVLAISSLGGNSGETLHLLRAESPGVNVGKMVPRMRRNSRILYLIYIGITVLMFVFLVFDMPFFDALTTAFATAGTGGFSIRNAGMSVYSHYSQTVITVFMMLFSVNFSVYYLLLLRQFRRAFRSEELWVFLSIYVAAVGIITGNIIGIYGTLREAVHQAAFTVATVVSTSGFAISDFDAWPWLSKTILVVLMFMGACAGSTGGGFKVIRLLLLGKIAARGVRRAAFPREVRMIHLDRDAVDEDTVRSVTAFGVVYSGLLVLFLLLVATDGLDFTTTFSAVVSSLNNIGPALGKAGPMMNYTCFSPFSRLVLALAMLFGRLELYPMMLLFVPSVWKK